MYFYPKYFRIFLIPIFILTIYGCKKDKNTGPLLYDFSYDNTLAGEITSFEATCDSTVVLLSEYWNFGDGSSISSSSAPTVEHNYKLPGTYIVTMIPNGDNTHMVKKQITITPNFTFTYSGTPIVGDTIYFQFPGYLPVGTTCLWEFGDGTSSTDSIPYHIYRGNGTFTINLKVNTGGTNTDMSESIIIFNDPIYTHEMTTSRSWYEIEHSYILGGLPYYNVYDTITNIIFALTYVNELTISNNSNNFAYSPSLSSGNVTVFSSATCPQSQISTISYNHVTDSMTISTYCVSYNGPDEPSAEIDIIATSQ